LSLAARRRLLRAGLALVAMWPAAQLVLVHRWNANPWELGGLAMYTQPDLPVEVRLRAPSGELLEPGRLGPEVDSALRQYRARAKALGLLSHAGGLASALRKAGVSHTHVDIEVSRTVLSADGRLVPRTRTERVKLP
jgi:hypothetical protein